MSEYGAIARTALPFGPCFGLSDRSNLTASYRPARAVGLPRPRPCGAFAFRLAVVGRGSLPLPAGTLTGEVSR
jgi:hypothetical protein